MAVPPGSPGRITGIASCPASRHSALAVQVSKAKLGTSLSFHTPAMANSGWSAQASHSARRLPVVGSSRPQAITAVAGTRQRNSLLRRLPIQNGLWGLRTVSTPRPCSPADVGGGTPHCRGTMRSG